MMLARTGFRGPVPESICQLLRNPIAQGAIQWEQGSQCFTAPFSNLRVCPNDYGIQTADFGSFLSIGCGIPQPTPAGMPSCPPGYTVTETGGCEPPWYERWTSWLLIGGAVVGGGVLVYALRRPKKEGVAA